MAQQDDLNREFETTGSTGTSTEQNTGREPIADTVAIDPNKPLGDTTTLQGQVGALKGGYEDVYQAQRQGIDRATTAAQPGYDAGGVASAIGENVSVGAGRDYVTEESLVQNQLKQILGEDSPLMQQAKSRGEVQASRMGQLGSSMGIGAAQGQMIASALPIAQADAKTFGQANLTQQQAENQLAITQGEGVVAGALESQKGAINERHQAIQNSFQTALQSADQASAAILQDAQNQWNEKFNQMEIDFEKWATEYQVTAQQKENLMQRRADALLSHQMQVQELLGNPEFIGMGEEATNLLNAMANGTIASIKYDMLASGWKESDPALQTYLNDLAEELTFTFDDSGLQGAGSGPSAESEGLGYGNTLGQVV